jgi:hypothetical protein
MSADEFGNPLQEGGPNSTVGQDGEVETQENSSGNWESQAKYFQSEKDKLQAENSKLKEYQEIGQFLESRPDIVNKIVDESKSGQPAKISLKPDEFDPWEAYNDPSSNSYKFRMQEMQDTVNSAVGQATQGIKKQASRTSLQNKLSQQGLSPDEVNSFMKFAQKHPSEYGIDNVIKMWRAISSDPTQGSNLPPNTNPLDKVRQVQNQPPSGGVLQGQRPQAPQSDEDAMWKGVLDANRVGNKVP